MPKATPLFSVIITCYNYENFVQFAIESVLRQRTSDFEIIVVNDGSSDDSWNVINRYSALITAINTTNCGSIAACLTGLAASRGCYVLFLDADDILDEEALLRASRHIQPDVSKIQFMLRPINALGDGIGDPFPKLTPDYGTSQMIESINRLGLYPTPPTSGNIYRRDIYLTLGEISYDFGIDGVAYLVAPFKGKVVHIDEVLGQYRMHSNNSTGFGSHSYARMERERAVFQRRLDHLAELLKIEPTIDESLFTKKNNYFYAVERDVFIDILKYDRLRFITFARYIRQAYQSQFGVERLTYFVFGLLLFISPKSMARSLMEFSLNPRRGSKLRILIKRVVRWQAA